MPTSKLKCKLSVNVNKIATLRNSRGGELPNVLTCAQNLIRFGAQGITVHPRPDERHIKKQDVIDIHRLLKKINLSRRAKSKVEFNIEGYPSKSFLKMILKIKPDQVTLVPDKPDAITSNAGWNLSKNKKFLRKVVRDLHNKNIRVSLFIDVFKWSRNERLALLYINPHRVELYTERFAKNFTTKSRARTTHQYARVAHELYRFGFDINAGHDLNLQNLGYLLKKVPSIVECSIGHALISESLYLGFEKTIASYLKVMRLARS